MSLCQTPTQLPSEDLAESLSQQQNRPLQDETDASRKDYERHKKWVQEHPERAREHANNWHRRHREEVLAKNKTPERVAKKQAYSYEYMRRPEVKARRRARYHANPEPQREVQRIRSKTDSGRQYQSAYKARLRRDNPEIHFANWVRGSVNRILRNGKATKTGRTMEYIGCAFEDLKAHLESQFSEGMTWEIGRGWDVDHIVAVKWFVLTDDEEAKVCCNYKNLRPMWSLDNKYKSDKLPNPLPSWLPSHIATRILERAKA